MNFKETNKKKVRTSSIEKERMESNKLSDLPQGVEIHP